MLDTRFRRTLPMIGMLLIIGIVTASRTLERESMAGVRKVDVVSLMGAGFAIGVAFGLLGGLMSARRQSSVG